MKQPYYDRLLPLVQHIRARPPYAHTRFLMIGTRVTPHINGIDYFAIGSVPTAIMRTIARYCAQNAICEVEVFHRFDRATLHALQESIRLMPELSALSPATSIRFISSPLKPK